MSATWLTDLAEHLEDRAVGTVGTSIFIGFMPPTPTACVVVYDAGGTSLPHGIDVPWSEYRAEIRVRAASHSAATTLANKVITEIDHKAQVTWNSSTVVQWVRTEGTAALIEYDQQRRAILLIRVVLQAQRSAVY